MTDKREILIYDTTLRDGAQGEGISFSAGGKLRMARRLDTLKVDYIEGGYPGSNEKDRAFFKALKAEGLNHSKLVAFGSTRRKRTRVQDDRFVAELVKANVQIATIFGKTWKLHVKDVLRTSMRENRAMISDTVGYLKEKGMEVFFDAEHFFDGYKDDPDFAMSALQSATSAGADVLVLCDTNGGSLPHEIHQIVGEVVSAFKTVVGIHTHNDAGLAVANVIEAVRAGASHLQGTVNGIGERCGNADLCTVIPNLTLKLGMECNAGGKLTSLREMSLFADDLVNNRHNRKSPYVGISAFSHKGGPHVDAVRKNPRTFEHIEPESVGNSRRILVSELSGSSNVLLKAIELGVGKSTSKEDAAEILSALKKLEQEGYAFEAADASFRMLIQKVLKEHKSFFELQGFRVIVEKRGANEPCISEAAIKVKVNDEVSHTVAEGDGPVNALDSALRKALLSFYPEVASVVLTDFRVSILDPEEATAAKTRVLIESSDGEANWGTVGVSENIIEASWEALVDSVEYKLFREEEMSRAAKAKTRKGRHLPGPETSRKKG